jgi:hypothetical protein
MTGNEAISVLLNAYKYEVEKGGRACGKTALRTALLMGANAISLIQKAMGDDEYYGRPDEEFEAAIKSKLEELEPYWKKVIAIYTDN